MNKPKPPTILLLFTLVPLMYGFVAIVPTGDSFLVDIEGRVWCVKENGVNIKNSLVVPSAVEVFGNEAIEPASDVVVTAYYRVGEEVASEQTTTDTEGHFNLTMDLERPCLIVFEKEGKTLFSRFFRYPSEQIENEFEFILPNDIIIPKPDIKSIESQLPERHLPPVFSLHQFPMGYAIGNCIVLVGCWIYVLVRMFTHKSKRTKGPVATNSAAR